MPIIKMTAVHHALLCVFCLWHVTVHSFMISTVRSNQKSTIQQLVQRRGNTFRSLRNPDWSTDASSFIVSVSDGLQSVNVTVYSDETILAALERTQIFHQLSLSEAPSDCRRGNCLTCSAKVLGGSGGMGDSLVQDDGLSPAVSEWVTAQGYVLTCSSHVTGPGVQLLLGENHNVWQKTYRERLREPAVELAARQAMARTIRRSAENNVEQWAKQTEEVLRKSGNDDGLL